MATTCSVYKHGILLGTGSVDAGSATLSSWSAAGGAPAVARKNVQILITGAGNSIGKTFNTQVLTDNTTTLTLRDACPFVGA
jgi:hypothetical protein